MIDWSAPIGLGVLINAVVTIVTVLGAVIGHVSRKLRQIEQASALRAMEVEGRLKEQMNQNQAALASLVKESKEDRHELRGAIQAVSNRVAVVEGILMGRIPIARGLGATE